MLFHIFVGTDLAAVLWLYAIGTMVVPLVSIGGSDFLAQVVATRMSGWRYRLGHGTAAIVLVTFVTTAILAAISGFLRKDLAAPYFIGLLLYVFSMACFQHVSRIQRSFGRLDAMFGATLLRQVIDFFIFTFLFVGLQCKSVLLVFALETGVTWGVLLYWPGLLVRIAHFRYITQAIRHLIFNPVANGFWGASLVSVAAIQWYRVLAGFLLGSAQYSVLALASLNQTILMSGGAMIYSFIYAHLVQKWTDTKSVSRFTRKGIQLTVAAAIIFSPIQGLCFTWIVRFLVPNTPISVLEAILAALTGWLYLFPIAEVFLTLKTRSVVLMKANLLNLLVSNIGLAAAFGLTSLSVSAILLSTVIGRLAALAFMYWTIRSELQIQRPIEFSI